MELMKFNIRIDDDDGIDVEAFKRVVEERGNNREELVRGLIRQFLNRVADDEQYYTIKGYAPDHTKYADIRNMDGLVNWHSDGIEYNSTEWRVLEHAVALAERGEKGDKEEAVKLFQAIFGTRNVFVKDE